MGQQKKQISEYCNHKFINLRLGLLPTAKLCFELHSPVDLANQCKCSQQIGKGGLVICQHTLFENDHEALGINVLRTRLQASQKRK